MAGVNSTTAIVPKVASLAMEKLAFSTNNPMAMFTTCSEGPMVKSTPLSLEFDSELDRRLSETAVVLDQPKAAVVERAVREFLELRDWQDTAIDEGLRAAEEGRLFEHGDVADWVASWGQPNERPMPRCD